MYGSEVWGIYEKNDYNSWEKDISQKARISLCKHVLGVEINNAQT